MKSQIIHSPRHKLDSKFFRTKRNDIAFEFDAKISSTENKALKIWLKIQKKYHIWKLSSYQNLYIR